MFLSNTETCVRGEAFDCVVEQTGRALRDPQVVQTIGETLATELLDLNSRLFLPDVRHGAAYLPDDQKTRAAPVLLPVAAQEVPTLPFMIDPIMNSFMRHWPFNDMRAEGCKQAVSVTYDIAADFDDLEFWIANPRSTKRHDAITMGSPQSPLLATNFNSKLHNGRFSVTRPIVVMEYETMQSRHPDEIPSGMAHELVHARDVLQEGPFMVCDAYFIASEYCAYHVDNAVGAAVGQPNGHDNMLPAKVEAFRLKHADPERPFAPTLEMVMKAHELNIV